MIKDVVKVMLKCCNVKKFVNVKVGGKKNVWLVMKKMNVGLMFMVVGGVKKMKNNKKKLVWLNVVMVMVVDGMMCGGGGW